MGDQRIRAEQIAAQAVIDEFYQESLSTAPQLPVADWQEKEYYGSLWVAEIGDPDSARLFDRLLTGNIDLLPSVVELGPINIDDV